MVDSAAELLISARDVTVRHGTRAVLDRVAVDVRRGEIVTVIGLNGAGKSTLLRVLLGLVRPAAGRIERARGLRVGYSPQHLNRDATLPLSVERFLRLGARRPRAELAKLLEELGAGAVLELPLSALSGGELHRVMLARALLREPDLLVLDEPLAGVDVTGQSELYQLIARLRDAYGFGVLLVSHDLHLVMAATDHVVCLNRHVCCDGRPESVMEHPEYLALFGSELHDNLAVYTHNHDHRHNLSGETIPKTSARQRSGSGT